MDDLKIIIEQLVDHLMPELTPYESALYIFLLRNSYINNESTIRIGKRTIANNFVHGVRGNRVNYKHVTTVLKRLEEKGCIKVGDTNREGTLYKIILPGENPLVTKKILNISEVEEEEDYFNNPEKRKELFERDKWICYYCGEKVTEENATLDHLIPQSKGGKHTKDNLKTSCFICNSIKSGKTYEEAAPFLLKNIQERKVRSS
jgi:uncharacterized protein YacL (UPF0231 family)